MLPGCSKVGQPHLLHPLVARLSEKGSMHLYAQLSCMLANSSPIKKQKRFRFAIHAIKQDLSALAVSLTHVAGLAASSSWQHMNRSFAACPQGRRALCRNGAQHNWPGPSLTLDMPGFVQASRPDHGPAEIQKLQYPLRRSKQSCPKQFAAAANSLQLRNEGMQ